MIKIAIFCALVACAVALPVNPAPYKAPVYDEKPDPFQYAYGVKDEYSGSDFTKNEAQDNYGNVQGEYRVNLPDGRVQIVTYTADNEAGFVADVKYEGTPVYPEAPKGGYPTYHPTA